MQSRRKAAVAPVPDNMISVYTVAAHKLAVDLATDAELEFD